MDATLPRRTFLRSRTGHGCLLYIGFSAFLSILVAWGFYSTNLSWFKEHKSEEKITALQLVDAFVSSYSDLRGTLSKDAPVPSTFRAHSIELFNKAKGEASEFRLLWVGRPGREIKSPPADAAMGKTIEHFVGEADPKAVSEMLTVNGSKVFRTVYPSFARQQSCVDCHNAIQPGLHWKLGDLMGAFAIDVPAGAFLASNLRQALGLGLALFITLGLVGVVIARVLYRQLSMRESIEGSLKLSEERFRDFAESASDWFWEQDANFRFVYLSHGSPAAPQGNSILGKTRREVYGDGAVPGLNDGQLAAHEADLAARRPFQNMRFQRIGSEGEFRHISISGKPIFDAEGRFRGYRGTGRDVTAEVAAEMELASRIEARTAELRKAQSELLRKERLSTLGQLTATVAHELRNPLSSIRNTVFAIREATGAGSNLERPLGRVERNIERCDRIISDLLDFTRLRELNRTEIEADAWLEEILNEQRFPDGIALSCALGAPGCTMRVDGERMRRVVINLIENAAQALAEAKEMTDRRIGVATRAVGASYELVVEDNGPGIPAEVLPKVFEPLFSTKSFGTGLGLPTVKQIVEQHGGTVEIVSARGAGTRIIVRLPIASAEEMAA